ncbi:CgeB family protein [Acidomonas methanolica]|uniref:hypothetical protein n=1 Tax=Acidomonas methanolica TaxID=437 RepID=UPI00211A45E6|nr:hypothetical protein [Acidomonas methanolica]
MLDAAAIADQDQLYAAVKESGLFDANAYLAANSDVARSKIDPLLHYIRYGQYESQRRPYPGFDPQRYISDFRLGTVEGNPFFDLVVRNRYSHATPEAALTPQEIYLYNLILHLDLFDEKYYVRNNPDLKDIEIPPLIHYVKYGVHEPARSPNRKYNNVIYMRLFGRDIPKDEPPFLHYVRNNLDLDFFDKGMLEKFSYASLSRVARKLAEFPFYSDAYYLSVNEDVNNSDLLPNQHAILYGIPEGRTILSKLKIAEVLGRKTGPAPDYQLATRIDKSLPLPETIGVFYHSDGNCFIREIAEDLAACLSGAGLNVSLETEKTPLSAKPDLCIFCAPHEFFFLDGGKQWEDEKILESSIMLNTEQAQTPWFSRGLVYLLMSAGIIDFLYQNTGLFEAVGIPFFHFDPIPSSAPTKILDEDRAHAFFRVLPDSAKKDLSGSALRPIAERDIDISFFGNVSAKREKFFTRNADFLARRECFIYYRKTQGPIRTEGVYEILARMPFYVAENSKICLNIHRNDDPYFEWHRIIKQGAARGAVVVTEECLPTPLYREGVHFLAETPRHMPHLVAWLLDSPDGQARAQEIQNACLDLFRNRKLQKSKFNDIAGFIGSVWQKVAVNA